MKRSHIYNVSVKVDTEFLVIEVASVGCIYVIKFRHESRL